MQVVLHRHALECVFKFLRLSELACVVTAVSKLWCDAVCSMGVRRDSLDFQCSLSVDSSFIRSKVAHRHVTEVIAYCLKLSQADLAMIVQHFPHLTSLYCEMEAPQSSVVFPAQLRHMSLHVAWRNGNDIYATTALQQMFIGACTNLKHIVQLGLSLCFDLSLMFDGLACLVRLKRFSFSWIYGPDDLNEGQQDFDALSPSLCNAIRSMPALRHLTLFAPRDGPKANHLAALVASPHSLRLKSIYLCRIEDQHLDILHALPTLTTLKAHYWDCSAAIHTHMKFWPRLRELFVSEPDQWTPQELVTTLSLCPQIKILSLSDYPELNHVDLGNILSCLPQITELNLESLGLGDWSFLLKVPQLRHFSVAHCDGIWLDELSHMKHLRSVQIHNYSEQDDFPSDEMLAKFRVPSAILPTLEIFECSQNY